MPFLSTALSALGSLGSSLGGALGGIAGIAGKLATPALAAASVYSILKPGSGSALPQYQVPYGGGALALPGGAGLPNVPSLGGLLTGGALGAGLVGLSPFTPGSPYGGIGEPGGYFGGSTQIVPTQTRSGYRLPHQVMVPSPSNPSTYVTYVRAPAVRYRVSVSRAGRRRCTGGR